MRAVGDGSVSNWAQIRVRKPEIVNPECSGSRCMRSQNGPLMAAKLAMNFGQAVSDSASTIVRQGESLG